MIASKSEKSYDIHVTGTVWLHPIRMKTEHFPYIICNVYTIFHCLLLSRISNNFNYFLVFQRQFAVYVGKVYELVVRTSMRPCAMHCIPQLVFK